MKKGPTIIVILSLYLIQRLIVSNLRNQIDKITL